MAEIKPVNLLAKPKRQLFPEKLWELVNKPTSGIKWSPDGRRIEIERVQLEKFLQTKVFHHGSAKFRSNNFDSFIRQLHFYGFKKCGNSYFHDMFQRATPHAHHSMKRKYSSYSSLSSTISTPPTSPSHNNKTSSAHVKQQHQPLDRPSKASHSKMPNLQAIPDLSNDLSSSSSTSSSTSTSSLTSPCTPPQSPSQLKPLSLITSKKRTQQQFLCEQQQQHQQQKDFPVHTSTNELIFNDIDEVYGDRREELTMYTIDSNTPVLREVKVEAIGNGNSIKIDLPKHLSEMNELGPKSLILGSFKNGNQNVLSAYFIYSTPAKPI